MILAERVIRHPVNGGGDIDARDTDWYRDALRHAGWSPGPARVIRRADSRPGALVRRLAEPAPAALRRPIIALLAAVESRAAAHDDESPRHEVCILAEAV
jgi:hypothetical protein